MFSLLLYASARNGGPHISLPLDVAPAGRSDDKHEKLLHDLVEGITFSHNFTPTYHLVLISILCAISVTRWLSRRFFRNSYLPHYSPTGTSPTNIIGRSERQYVTKSTSSRVYAQDELAPLLCQSSHGSLQSNSRLRLRALLMYQPAPLPFVHKVLPANDTTLEVLCLLGINVFYLTFRIPFRSELVAVFADRAALLFVSNLIWLYLLAAKTQPIQFIIGLSYERLNIFHRRLGELLCLFAIFHVFGMLCVWYSILLPQGEGLLEFLARKIIACGLVAFISYELLYFTSLASLRQRWYELFLGTHVILQAIGLVALFLHHPGTRPYTAAALVIFLADRLLFRLYLKSRTLQAGLAMFEDGQTLLVSADWSLAPISTSKWARLFRWSLSYGWQPAQHLFITAPGLAKRQTMQAHPFTIASAAPAPGQRHAWLNLIIRARDGFTNDLAKHAQTSSSISLRFDGPYGCSHAMDLLLRSDMAVLVAGGSGISVAYPLLWRLAQWGQSAIRSPLSRICLIWVVREACNITWIGQDRLDELREVGIDIIVPSPTSKGSRPDLDSLIRNSVGAFGTTYGNGRVGVVVSGPDEFNRRVRNTCAALAWQGRDIEVAVEKFGW